MTDVDVAIVGAGALGLACAAAIARTGRSVVILEQHEGVGRETSSRNSGVVHAGIYYPKGSLKALTCVEGRERLYARCTRESLPYRKCGKVLVATTDDERAKLEALCAQGLTNGAGALRMLDAKELRQLEPNLSACAALLSPETGIVDSHALLASYRSEALARGAELCLHTRVERLEPLAAGGLALHTGDATLRARCVVNAAGLHADGLAASAGIDVDAAGYRQRPCKGDYFVLGSRLRGVVSRLVYPVPAQAGLGIHVTLDLDGGLRAGPDACYVDELRYDVDPAKAPAFAAALRRYLPGVRDEDLQPDYSGIRPKLSAQGEPARDFVIEEASRHGVPGLIQLAGIESPGLTASEAIAARVVALLP